MHHFSPFVAMSILLTISVTGLTQPPVSPTIPKTSPGEWTMFGGTTSRNMVNLRDKLPTFPITHPRLNDDDATRKKWEADWELWEKEWLLWKADLGSRSYAQPIVAGGKVFVGTNNERPRNKREQKKGTDGDPELLDKGILICFDAKSGKFLWQAVHDTLPSDRRVQGITSSPTVVGDRVYYVSNQHRVVCLDANGLNDGNQGTQTEKYQGPTDADFVWEYDLIKELKVFPSQMSCPGSYWATNVLVVGDLLFAATGNGVDEQRINLPSPNAPSFVCLNRHTGKLVWKDHSPGKEILHAQWGSPAYASEPVPQVIFPGGDGWLWAFDPPTGKLLWKFDCNPKGSKYDIGGTGRKCHFMSAPVIDNHRLYIGTGQDPEHFTGPADLWCVDLKKAVECGKSNPDRDVSPDLVMKREKQQDGKQKVTTKANPASAKVWNYSGVESRKHAPQDFKFGRTMSTICIVDDVVYAPDLGGLLHCLDAKTGKHYWRYDLRSAIWGSPYYIDGKLILASESGDLFIFRHEKHHEVYDEIAAGVLEKTQKQAKAAMKTIRDEVEKKYLISKIEMDAQIRGTPSVANGIFYLATEKTLYAFGKP